MEIANKQYMPNKHLNERWSNYTYEPTGTEVQDTTNLIKTIADLAGKKKTDSAPAQSPTPSYIPPPPSPSFFSTPTGIAVIILGVASVAVGGFLAYKHFKK